MRSSTETSQVKHDESRAKGMEDSPMMTVEFLRARLLSERSVSKAAKERTDELAKRVKELEEQLKFVTFQRKRAEKATLDVLSCLESQGVSDISEVYESESDQEESLYESNVDKSSTTREDENFGTLESKRNNKESSGSDHESAPSSAGSLSWNGRKTITEHFEKDYLDSRFQRQTSFGLANSSPRHRLGKSCRQIKRRDMRSAVEESRHVSTKFDVQDSSTLDTLNHHVNYLDSGSEQLIRFHQRRLERSSKKKEVFLSSHDQAPGGDANSSNLQHKFGGEMEKALKHQAQLIGLYEGHEKAQKDWEEKYGENNISTRVSAMMDHLSHHKQKQNLKMEDSGELGNHSDVTEERYDSKAPVPDRSEVAASHGHDQKAGTETIFQGNKSSITQFNSFKISPDVDTGCFDDHNISDMQSCRSPAADFAFPTVTGNQYGEHGEGQSLHAADDTASHALSGHSESHFASLNGYDALVHQEEPPEIGLVLNALLEAKLHIKRQMNSLPENSGSVGKAIASEPSVPATRDVDWLNSPVGYPGLFRVPTDLQSQSPSQSTALVLDKPLEVTDSYARAPYLPRDHYFSSPMESWHSSPSGDTFSRNPVYGTEVGISTGPRVHSHFNTNIPSSSKSTLPSSSGLPDLFPPISSHHMLYGQSVSSEARIPPSGNPLSYYQDKRPYMYM